MKHEYRIFITPKEVTSFMQNAEGEVTIKNNKDKSFFEQNTF